MNINKEKKFLKPILFDKEDDSFLEHLAEYGYAVIQNVLNDHEIKQGFKLFYKDWKHVSPNFDFENISTWTTDNSPMMWGKGMIYANGLGQSDFQWYLRTRDNIKNIWKKIHKTDDLVTSFDGFSVFLDKRQKPKQWLHVDQGNSEKMLSIQGAYNFLKVSELDAGFIIVPNSHKTFKHETKKKGDFIKLKDDNPHVQNAVKLIIPPNCFVLWNSKTVHASTGMDSKIKKSELNRLTSYITFFPKKDRSIEIFEKRIQGYKNGHNCSHWAIYHHVKKHPFYLKKRYEARNFNNITPTLINAEIPKNRLELI
jgi:hypothetical protein